MEENGRLQKSLKERKASIPYDKIDKGIREAIRLLNRFPFCITTSCCQGHATHIGGGTFSGNGYVTLEVLDEDKFLKFLEEIVPDFLRTTEMVLDSCKEYHFSEDGKTNYYHWRLSYSWGRDTEIARKEVEEAMLKGRKCLERLIQEYQWRHKDVLDG